MKTNKDIIESYNNFKLILDIKYKVALANIASKNAQINNISKFITEIENCLFEKYSIKRLEKLNGKLNSSNGQRHIIIFQMCENMDYILDPLNNYLFNKSANCTIIFESIEVSKKIVNLLEKKEVNIQDLINISEIEEDNFIKSNGFLSLVFNISKGILSKKGYKEIILISKLSPSQFFKDKIFPVKKNISSIICKDLHNSIKFFYPTKKIWSENISEELIQLKILIKILIKEKENLIIKSSEINENIDSLENKIIELKKEDKKRASLLISDELNIMQEGKDDNN